MLQIVYGPLLVSFWSVCSLHCFSSSVVYRLVLLHFGVFPRCLHFLVHSVVAKLVVSTNSQYKVCYIQPCIGIKLGDKHLLHFNAYKDFNWTQFRISLHIFDRVCTSLWETDHTIGGGAQDQSESSNICKNVQGACRETPVRKSRSLYY